MRPRAAAVAARAAPAAAAESGRESVPPGRAAPASPPARCAWQPRPDRGHSSSALGGRPAGTESAAAPQPCAHRGAISHPSTAAPSATPLSAHHSAAGEDQAAHIAPATPLHGARCDRRPFSPDALICGQSIVAADAPLPFSTDGCHLHQKANLRTGATRIKARYNPATLLFAPPQNFHRTNTHASRDAGSQEGHVVHLKSDSHPASNGMHGGDLLLPELQASGAAGRQASGCSR